MAEKKTATMDATMSLAATRMLVEMEAKIKKPKALSSVLAAMEAAEEHPVMNIEIKERNLSNNVRAEASEVPVEEAIKSIGEFMADSETSILNNSEIKAMLDAMSDEHTSEAGNTDGSDTSRLTDDEINQLLATTSKDEYNPGAETEKPFMSDAENNARLGAERETNHSIRYSEDSGMDEEEEEPCDECWFQRTADDS